MPSSARSLITSFRGTIPKTLCPRRIPTKISPRTEGIPNFAKISHVSLAKNKRMAR